MLLATLLVSSLWHFPVVGSDIAVTEYAISCGCAKETGLLQARIGGDKQMIRFLVGASAFAGFTFMDEKLERHKKLQWAFRLGHLALGSYVVYHNVREIQKYQDSLRGR